MEKEEKILTEDVLAKIRWNIDFINEEIGKIDISTEIKKEAENTCSDFVEEVFPKLEEDLKEEDLIGLMREKLNNFDEIIKKIDGDKENIPLFMLLITHIADIKFLLASEKEQERVMKAMEKK